LAQFVIIPLKFAQNCGAELLLNKVMSRTSVLSTSSLLSLAQSGMVSHQIPTSSLLSLAQFGMVLHQIQDQNHTSKTVETKSKTISSNRLFSNSYVGLYCSLQCGQLEPSHTCRNDVGISIFLFDHTMPNLTATTLHGAPVENIAITSAPRAHYYSEACELWKG
jgi:hypothetical protein